MANVKWIKITTSMFDDEKIKLIDAMPERDTIFYIWMRLLVQAGKTNASGYIFLNENVPYSEEMLSTIFNRQIGSIRLALQTLRNFEMIEISDNHFIKIANWDKHQNIDKLEKMKEQTRQRVANHRAKKKELMAPAEEELCGGTEDSNAECNVTEVLRNAIEEDREIDIEEDIDIEDRMIDKNNLRSIEQAYFLVFHKQMSAAYIGKTIEFLNKGPYGELIIYAINLTKQRMAEQYGKIKGYNYTLSIIESWINQGFKTPDDVEKHEGKIDPRPKETQNSGTTGWNHLKKFS